MRHGKHHQIARTRHKGRCRIRKRRHWKHRRILRRRHWRHHQIPRRQKKWQGLQKGRRIRKGRSYPRVGSSPSAAIFHQIMSRRTWSRRVYAGLEGAAPQSSLPTNEEGNEESVSMCDGGGTMIFRRKAELPEPIARGMSPEQ